MFFKGIYYYRFKHKYQHHLFEKLDYNVVLNIVNDLTS